METPQHQEWRSRQAVDWRAIWKTALFAGGILFVMSGGAPWTTAGTMNAAMGRDLPLSLWSIGLLHFALAYVYSAVLAHAIYRLHLVSALVVGAGTGVALYAANYAFFHFFWLQMQSPELRAVLVHISFALFASATYKGASVPIPFQGNASEVKRSSDALIPRQRSSDPEDPEPQPVAR